MAAVFSRRFFCLKYCLKKFPPKSALPLANKKRMCRILLQFSHTTLNYRKKIPPALRKIPAKQGDFYNRF